MEWVQGVEGEMEMNHDQILASVVMGVMNVASVKSKRTALKAKL